MTQTILENSPQLDLNMESRIMQAAAAIPPVWPLENAIACNPLLHLEELNFWEAIDTALNRYASLSSKDRTRTEFVNRQVIKWVQSYLDKDIAKIRMPGRHHSFYAAWRDLALFDGELIKSKQEKRLLSHLPRSALDAVEFVIEEIGISDEEIDTFISEQISQLPGWAGYIRWRSEWDRSASSISLTDFLAVRLGIYWIALQKKELDQVPSFRNHPPKKSIERKSIENKEHIFAETFINRVLEAARIPRQKEEPAAQWVFCIDVRSESYRYQLEQIGNYETYGFAGFFGFPVSIAHPNRGTFASCPVLLQPKWVVIEKENEHRFFKRLLFRIKRLCNDSFHELKSHFGTPFALAETTGAYAGLWMALKSLTPRISDRVSEAVSSTIGSNLNHSIPLKDQVDSAESALRMMGLLKFAPLVVLCGHRSSSKNNPFASSLDCGACGGNHGGQNARLLSAILNSPAVRYELNHRGILIPKETLFVGAEHDTTTDEICFFEESSHLYSLQELKRDALKAGIANRMKRSCSFGHGQNPSEKEPMRQSLDWSEVRPEWGLAKNGAFLVGPRRLSDSLDLQGRAFLHSYDWEEDADGSYLETILTAPMVVAQWINMQYFFSSLDPIVFGSGSKTTQNVVGKIGVMQGNGSDLMHGLPLQSVFASDTVPYHESLRLLTVVFAPLDRIERLIGCQMILQKLFYNEWVNLITIDPITNSAFKLDSKGGWKQFKGTVKDEIL
ncbi:MAG: DUF2309 domain-containing protein [Verrucomicrobia bacterium]|nr:DUF2309 domain-containing protein [Verrucomicrobiota bacterium]